MSATLPGSTVPKSVSLRNALATLIGRRLNRLHRRQPGFDEHHHLLMDAESWQAIVRIRSGADETARFEHNGG